MKSQMLLVTVATAAMLLSNQAMAQAYNPYGSGYGNDLPSQWEQQQRRSAENSR